MVAAEYFIIGKGKDWLLGSRPDITGIPYRHMWSKYQWDAKRFSNIRDARIKAKAVKGDVFRFNPATGKSELVKTETPKGAKCDDCTSWTPFNGVCRNPNSVNYKEPVSMKDVCDEWEAKIRTP